MGKSNKDTIVCEVCNNVVKDDDDYCHECGSIFIDDLFCKNHKDIIAEGVCIICSTPYCNECGAMINNHFLCVEHSHYEIFEGMARVYGTVDETTVQYVKTCLEQDGLSPVLLSSHSPYGGSGFSYGLFNVAGNSLGNEIKVMIPCQDVLKAEEGLRSIDTKK